MFDNLEEDVLEFRREMVVLLISIGVDFFVIIFLFCILKGNYYIKNLSSVEIFLLIVLECIGFSYRYKVY